MDAMKEKWSFEALVGSIRKVHYELAAEAGRAVNVSLTLRNWLIGFYIGEYEQHGEDRAQYGESLMDRLSAELCQRGIPRSDARELRRYRHFCSAYPQIREALPPEFRSRALGKADSGVGDSQIFSASQLTGKTLISRLSFTHLAELIAIDDATNRAFYEIECIRGNWSVRELKRQINSLYYECSGLSKDKKKLAELAQESAASMEFRQITAVP